MIVKKILSCAAVMSALLFSDVCAAQDALSLVPADAGVVMRIEAGRILEKMGGEDRALRSIGRYISRCGGMNPLLR